ncbi:transcription factor GTE7-like [Silene latifolia]|uniref:transcription factor GTE7-like n=1 Tax=Silene latifolia TaxID=37657 RepID=UPI003D778858
MAKSPFFSNPNPNPSQNNNHHNNSSSRKQFTHQINNNGDHELNPNDTMSFNRRGSTSFSHYVNFDISAYSKDELYKLKVQLISELHKIRTLSNRIDKSGESKKRPSPFPQINPNGKQQHLTPPPAPPQQPPYAASQTVMKMCSTVLKKLSNQKAGSWFNTPVDVIGMGLHDYHTVIDRPMDLGTIRKKMDKGTYITPEEFAVDVRLTFNNALRYNPKGHEVNTLAGQYLALFEQWSKPIFAKFNAEKQLHFQQLDGNKRVPPPPPLQQPQPVPVPVAKPVRENVNLAVVEDEVQESSWSKIQSPEPPPPPKVLNAVKKPPESKPKPEARTPQPEIAPVVMPAVVERSGGRGRPPEGKLPKPKAKDPDKRAMSMEEKQKLGNGLQNLPEEKMSQVVNIIRKRNGPLDQDGDEIELDIEAVDTETLWELDRFVTNYKKMVSKIKRQALMGGPLGNNVGHSDDTNQGGMSDKMVEMSSKAKKGGGDVGEEDVDIGDEMPVNNFPPLEIDKDDDRQHVGGGAGGGGGGASSSSSGSSSDDSSSSGSDSGSSSGSDSDVDDAQSRDKESKNFQS